MIEGVSAEDMGRLREVRSPFGLKADIVLEIAAPEIEQDHDLELEDALEPNCRVYIHNDDVTPFEFVIVILRRIFQIDLPRAELITYEAHSNGIAYVTTLPCPEANRRVGKAHFAASLDGYPLMFTVEQES